MCVRLGYGGKQSGRIGLSLSTCLPTFLLPSLPACRPACLQQVTKEEYARHGAATICDVLISQLRSSGKKPYYIPVGGSSALGVWGYIAAVAELDQQAQEAGLNFDVITSVRGVCTTLIQCCMWGLNMCAQLLSSRHAMQSLVHCKTTPLLKHHCCLCPSHSSPFPPASVGMWQCWNHSRPCPGGGAVWPPLPRLCSTLIWRV